MEFHNLRKIKKTRKHHRCFLCNLEIPKGSKAHSEAGVFDGEFFSRYSHVECSEKWHEMNYDNYCGEDWCDFTDMAEHYPHTRFSEWQREIGQKYNVLDGDGL